MRGDAAPGRRGAVLRRAVLNTECGFPINYMRAGLWITEVAIKKVEPMLLTLSNLAVPSFAWAWGPAALLLLPCIVALEAVLLRRLGGLAWRTAWWSSAVANLITSVLGIPLLWLVLATIEPSALPADQTRWHTLREALNVSLTIGGGMTGSLSEAEVRSAWLVGGSMQLVFYCVGSMLIEGFVIWLWCRRRGLNEIGVAVGVGNLASYALIGALGFFVVPATKLWLPYLHIFNAVVDAVRAVLRAVF